MNLDKYLTEQYMRRMVRTPEGRAHILSQVAEAEDNGEARVFDDVLAFVDDPKLQKMIQIHRDDEIRHGRLFRECLARTGVNPGPVPDELKAIDRLERHIGGFFNKPVVDAHGVMMAYVILQVLEERALEQFPMYIRVFKEVDPESAEVFAAVAADEERHLKYCHAISRRYATSGDEVDREVARLRIVEAQAFKETQQENMKYIVAHDIMPRSPARLMWRMLGALGDRLDFIPLTQFARAAQPA